MATIERICPKCGTSNPSDRSRCKKCGTNLTNLPVPRKDSLPARVERTGGAALVLSAGALVARVGFQLFKDQILPWLAQELAKRPTVIDAEPKQPRRELERIEPRRKPIADDQPDYVIRGWRAWSVRRGDEHASGSENFEWRISRRRDGGADNER